MTYRTNCRTFDFVFLLLGNRLVINQYKRPFLKTPLESPVLAHLRFPRVFKKIMKKKCTRNDPNVLAFRKLPIR